MFKLIFLACLLAMASGAAVVYHHNTPVVATAAKVPDKASVAVSNVNGNYAYSISEQRGGPAYVYSVPVAPAVVPAGYVYSYVH